MSYERGDTKSVQVKHIMIYSVITGKVIEIFIID